MRKLYVMLILLTMGVPMYGQSLSLEYTSLSEARFFFYLNGKLLNEKSVGHIVIPNLEDAKYHLRIVVDDPYSVALTKTFRPKEGKNQYDLLFNPVRERILVSRSKLESVETMAESHEETQSFDRPEGRRLENSKAKAPKLRVHKEESEPTGTTGKEIKTNKF